MKDSKVWNTDNLTESWLYHWIWVIELGMEQGTALHKYIQHQTVIYFIGIGVQQNNKTCCNCSHMRKPWQDGNIGDGQKTVIQVQTVIEI